MKLIDTHAHLYLPEFATDVDKIIERAEAIGVEKIYLPAINNNQINNLLLLEGKYPHICIAMMGLHPCYVKEDFKSELTIIEQWLTKRKFAAIGEIGLDFYWDKTFLSQQYESLRIQIELSLQYNLPVVLHTRNAMHETIEIIKEYMSKGIYGIFHCFSGNYEEAKKIIDNGFYLGIGGVVTYKNVGLAEAIKRIDLKYLVLETDSPYLTPVPFRGKRNESSYLKFVADKIAAIKNISVEEVAVVTTINAGKIFSV